MWMCLRSILGSERAPDSTRAISQLPFSLGGLGLTSAVRSRVAAHWSSWADCIHMIRQRHPSVAETLITGIHRGPAPCLAAVRTCQGTLEEAGLEIPSWRTLADTPPQREGGAEPAEPKVGWQHRATRCLEDQHLRVQLWPTLTDPVRALMLMRSQCGPLASAALTALPTSRATRLDNHSACGCVDASSSHSHCPLAPADVAASLTCMAIVQRVRGLGCWEPGFPA